MFRLFSISCELARAGTDSADTTHQSSYSSVTCRGLSDHCFDVRISVQELPVPGKAAVKGYRSATRDVRRPLNDGAWQCKAASGYLLT
ncbi:hypothetical protein BaRGS_00018560 [Batillaria attramentaria]|uniref:Secreted protein n=1 Tax=Batillaria attramentaria TaxID=370345 RepID=A0ABD0KSE8_9CAEN